jgi:hypothetical protein
MTSIWTNGLDRGKAPPHWVRERDGSYYCLVCRRERAVEAALDEAGDSVGTEARAKLRSSALVKFEIKRDPERTEGEIAKAARTSIAAVRKARTELGSRRSNN